MHYLVLANEWLNINNRLLFPFTEGSNSDSEEVSASESESPKKEGPSANAPRLHIDIKVCCVCLTSYWLVLLFVYVDDQHRY